MDSSDKIKLLLEDFEEREALTQAEISEIESQISELEELIEASKKRIESVARDKEKVNTMRNRYAKGDWTDVLAKASEKIAEGIQTESDKNGNHGVETSEVESVAESIEEPDFDEVPELDFPEPSEEPAQEPARPQPSPAQQTPLPEPVAIPEPPQPAVEPQPPRQPVHYTPSPDAHHPVQEVSPVALDNPDAPPILPGIANPPTGFDGMQTPPSNVPQPAVEPQPPAHVQEQAPEPAEEESSLFPFHQDPDEGTEMDQDTPWSNMSWESSGVSEEISPVAPEQVEAAHQNLQAQAPQFNEQPPNPNLQAPPQPPAMQPPQMPPGIEPPAMPAAMQPPAMPAAIQPPNMPPATNVPPAQQAVIAQGQMQNPQQQQGPQSVEFDISDALKPENDDEGDKDDKNQKKINDALKGLFS